MIRTTLLFALLLCLTVAAEARTFVISAIPDEDQTRLQERFDKVAAYLSEELGVEVEYVPVKSYAAVVSAFGNDQVHLGWFGGLTGVQARDQAPGAQAIAQGAEDPTFKSYFIAHASTGIERSKDFPKDIKGKTFTFGSKVSTSGRLMPEYFIRQHLDAEPDEVFERVGFSSDHSRTLALVQSGAYQTGAMNYKVWQAEEAAGNMDPEKVSIVWVTPPYPDYQWTIRGDVNQTWGKGFTQKVTQALLDMDEKAPQLLALFPREAFIPANNGQFERIRKVAVEVDVMDEY